MDPFSLARLLSSNSFLWVGLGLWMGDWPLATALKGVVFCMLSLLRYLREDG
jgi:hypothetical protein